MPIIEEIRNPISSQDLFKILKGCQCSFFLDSSLDHKGLGRYSFLGCEPFLIFKSKKESVSLEWVCEGRKESFKSNPFSVLKDIFERFESVNNYSEIPFTSGGVGYFAYDLKDFIEELPDEARDDLNLPDCMFGFYDSVFVYDNLSGKAYIASSTHKRLKEFKEEISRRPVERSSNLDYKQPILKSNFSKASYMKAIGKAKEYIRKGDIYQVNLSQRFEASLNIEPFELYSRLRAFSPAPFSACLSFGDAVIISSSPERFLLKRKDYIETRPIKGTRPRGEDAYSDALLERELISSPKDRAEHVMIVDLERNDLGRVCEYGSVRPTEFIALEKYSTVFHLVSTVSGRLKKGIGPIDCLLATFPGGSITGAPKIRAMEIIEELEPVKRSVYTGTLGYIDFNGNMDTSIVIRTFVIKAGKVYFQVGGGIVADSDPEKEYEETLDKAKGLMRSLGIGLQNRELISIC